MSQTILGKDQDRWKKRLRNQRKRKKTRRKKTLRGMKIITGVRVVVVFWIITSLSIHIHMLSKVCHQIEQNLHKTRRQAKWKLKKTFQVKLDFSLLLNSNEEACSRQKPSLKVDDQFSQTRFHLSIIFRWGKGMVMVALLMSSW